MKKENFHGTLISIIGENHDSLSSQFLKLMYVAKACGIPEIQEHWDSLVNKVETSILYEFTLIVRVLESISKKNKKSEEDSQQNQEANSKKEPDQVIFLWRK